MSNPKSLRHGVVKWESKSTQTGCRLCLECRLWITAVCFREEARAFSLRGWDAWLARRLTRPKSVTVLLFCCSLVAQACPTLCDPQDCSLPGSSVHGILQARMPEWVAVPFSRGSSQPRDQTWFSHSTGGFFMVWATREAPCFASVCIQRGWRWELNCLKWCNRFA